MAPRLSEASLSLGDARETRERIVRFLRSTLVRTGAKYFVVGMSGGLDSSVAAVLCAIAVGGNRTLGFSIMEDETRSRHNLQDSEQIARKYGIEFKSLDFTTLVNLATGLVRERNQPGRIAIGNVKARLRAVILYYYANARNGIVVGTGDKSEIMLGYFTKYGDGACDIQPLADLYKTTIRDLAKSLGLPARIYSKVSSPELWPGQTAESELGLPYKKLDLVLWGLERWIPTRDVSKMSGVSLRTVESIRKRWLSAEHKRRPPLSVKLGFRTPGQDLRIPYYISE